MCPRFFHVGINCSLGDNKNVNMQIKYYYKQEGLGIYGAKREKKYLPRLLRSQTVSREIWSSSCRMNGRLFALVLRSASTVIPFVPPVHKYGDRGGETIALPVWGLARTLPLCPENQTVIKKKATSK